MSLYSPARAARVRGQKKVGEDEDSFPSPQRATLPENNQNGITTHIDIISLGRSSVTAFAVGKEIYEECQTLPFIFMPYSYILLKEGVRKVQLLVHRLLQIIRMYKGQRNGRVRPWKTEDLKGLKLRSACQRMGGGLGGEHKGGNFYAGILSSDRQERKRERRLLRTE